jgi:hypothetical protein
MKAPENSLRLFEIVNYFIQRGETSKIGWTEKLSGFFDLQMSRQNEPKPYEDVANQVSIMESQND